MKTVTKLALVGLTAFLTISAGVLANDSEWIAIDNHHGSFTYVHRPVEPATTIALYEQHIGIGRVRETTEISGNTQRRDLRPMHITPPQGTSVTYFAPAE
jgi:hypothetical protein